jgi:PAS domain S-box-containing protein
MKDEEKSKVELFSELQEARARITELENKAAQGITAEGKDTDHDDAAFSASVSLSEYRKVMQALRDCEETFRAFAENSLDVIMRFDRSFRHLYVNPAVERSTGIPGKCFLGKTHVELGFPVDLTKMWEEALQRVFDTAAPHRIEFMLPSGAWIDWLLVPEFKEDGEVYAVMTSARDITHMKQVEEKLKESQQRLAEIIKFLPDATLVIDEKGRVVAWNRAIEAMTELPAEKMLGKGNHEYAIPFYGERRSILIDLALRADEAMEGRYTSIRRQGGVLFGEAYTPGLTGKQGAHLSATASVLRDSKGQIIGAIECIRDTTERMKKDLALRESEQRLADMINFLPDATLVIDWEGRVISWNRAIERMTGVPAEEIIGKGNYEYAIPFYGERRPILIDLVLEPHDEVVDKYRTVSRYNGVVIGESYMPNLKGGTVYLLGTAAPLYDTSGHIVGAIESIRDITDRRKAEEALTIANERFSEVLNSFDALVFVVDMASHEVLFVNRYGRSVLGNLEGALCWQSVQPGQGGPCPFCTNEQLVDAEGKPTSGVVWEFPHQINDRWYECRDRAINWPDGRLVRLSIAIDITERKRAEEERQMLAERLHRAEKMEALGIMAGGVAHDLNNVLGVLVGYSELLLLEMPEDSRHRKHVQNILQSGQRGAAIIQDLLTLARRNVDTSEVVNLNTVVGDYFKTPEFEMLKMSHPGVTFEVMLDEKLLNLRGSPLHLGKTVMNLVSNAAEAMTESGRVLVGTMNRYLDNPIHGYDNMEEGDYVVLTVSDNGTGIPPANIGKIFEPFYTRKVMGRSGTGLGLAVVWGTVKDHRGYIDVKSEEGKGSLFTLYFPVTRDEVPTSRGKATFDQYRGRGEAILVVDDVEEQRDLAQRMLTRIGYHVATVASGEEAIRYLRTQSVDLIILDMIMGAGMDGYETYRRIHEINPQKKAIIVSGFSETDRVRKALELGAGAYVPKPYIMEQIGLAVRRELDKSSVDA